MSAVLVTGPAVEPISLDEAKAHLRVDQADEDLLISSLITAARLHLEVETRQAFITQTWSIVLDRWPEARQLVLPIRPVQTVNSVTVLDDDDIATVADPALYLVDVQSTPPRLVLRSAQSWPLAGRAAGGIDINLTAGFGDTPGDVPQSLRQAILLSVAHWYERRESVVFGSAPVAVPQSVSALVQPYRSVHL